MSESVQEALGNSFQRSVDFIAQLAGHVNGEILATSLAVMGLLCLSGFFSGSETAITAASQARLHAHARNGDKRAKRVGILLENRERLIGSLLLGNNLVNILASALLARLMLSLFGEIGVVYATLVMTVLVLIFAEVLPKTYAILHPDKVAMSVGFIVQCLVWVCTPFVRFIQVLVQGILKLLGNRGSILWSANDEIRGAVDWHHREGGVEKRARDQIIGVLSIGNLSVEDVMVHRKNISMLDADLPAQEFIKAVLASVHTRMPVWQKNTDNVIGVVHARDVLQILSENAAHMDEISISNMIREAWFVPETTPLVVQLKAFQQKREHFAIVVDEYGSLMGVVSLEDILEEIVGDIHDEFDHWNPAIRVQKDGSVLVNGDVAVRDLNRVLEMTLPEEEAVSIAGLVIHAAQTIPDVGRVFSFYNYRFEIMQRQRNQITLVRVQKIDA